MAMPSRSTVAAMLDACEARYKELVDAGVDEGVACDRTWDAYECAFNLGEARCFDKRDRLFESKLRTIRERG